MRTNHIGTGLPRTTGLEPPTSGVGLPGNVCPNPTQLRARHRPSCASAVRVGVVEVTISGYARTAAGVPHSSQRCCKARPNVRELCLWKWRYTRPNVRVLSYPFRLISRSNGSYCPTSLHPSVWALVAAREPAACVVHDCRRAFHQVPFDRSDALGILHIGSTQQTRRRVDSPAIRKKAVVERGLSEFLIACHYVGHDDVANGWRHRLVRGE